MSDTAVPTRLGVLTSEATWEHVLPPLRELLPMWRVGVFAAVMLVMGMTHLGVRLRTAELEQGLQAVQYQTQKLEARRTQLRLDVESRASVETLEQTAAAIGLVKRHPVRVASN